MKRDWQDKALKIRRALIKAYLVDIWSSQNLNENWTNNKWCHGLNGPKRPRKKKVYRRTTKTYRIFIEATLFFTESEHSGPAPVSGIWINHIFRVLRWDLPSSPPTRCQQPVMGYHELLVHAAGHSKAGLSEPGLPGLPGGAPRFWQFI